ncbi:transposase domain protein [Francisella tularensis subsp. novicida]|nr:transposase domain protein [Francisella tularensis subsp. novicida]
MIVSSYRFTTNVYNTKLSLIEHIILMKSGSIFKVYPLKLLSLVNQIL